MHSFVCSRENEYAEINLQWTLDNSNYHGTEKMVQIDWGVRDTESFFMKQATKKPENLFEQWASSD